MLKTITNLFCFVNICTSWALGHGIYIFRMRSDDLLFSNKSMLSYTANLIEALFYGVAVLFFVVAWGQIVNLFYLVKHNLTKGKELFIFNNIIYLFLLVGGACWSYHLAPLQGRPFDKVIVTILLCVPIIFCAAYGLFSKSTNQKYNLGE